MTFDLNASLREIEKVAGELSSMPTNFLGPVGATIPDIEWFALAAIKKTASLSHAFCSLIRAKNTLSAAELVRLQLDTALRMFGLTLISDLEAAGRHLMNDGSYRKLRSHDNQPLTDAYLHRKLNERYPGLTEAYEDASAFVHLTGLHIKTGLWPRPGSPTLYFDLSGTDDSRPDEWFADLVDAFDQATKLTADLTSSFIRARRVARVPA
ncbi:MULTISPECIES: hypothetical protein [unclassified Rhizobium]|uniref:hypothetical protein n=1 Tax=unclassified Rhizobium TaxID=2613769 RepID=UPI001ADC1A26|nr:MULTISPECIES: hypothetical protein [unclassified Rhizobium]MBO9127936.1 hypothetical protein [Rhizobium sp. 16-488-2b]MBO9178513.1 hypothetical protein [Rhizobium sp. 16-488-2a]